ncbi:type II toxin-antitoxin system RelE family toxin [Streptomyces sp. LARHCF252]
MQTAETPRLAASTPFGWDFRRLRVGDYRVLYAIDDEVIHLLVPHLGRTT